MFSQSLVAQEHNAQMLELKSISDSYRMQGKDHGAIHNYKRESSVGESSNDRAARFLSEHKVKINDKYHAGRP